MKKVSSVEFKKRNITIWNEVAPRYHKRWASTKLGPFQSTDKLIQLIHPKKGDRVLDIACGTGAVTKKLIPKVRGTGLVVGADTSITALKLAKKSNKKSTNLLFINMDAEKFSFNGKFNIITCQYALFFFPKALTALKNMKKYLVKSGKLGVSVHGNNVPFFTSTLNAVTQFIPDYILPGAPALDRYSTKNALKQEVKKAGFSNIIVKDFVFKYSPGKFEDYWKNYLQYIPKPLKIKLDSLEKSEKRQLRELIKENTKPFTKRNEKIEFPWEVLILTAKNE
ncbi:MAG: methyltransferase domain-containing protein [Nitrosopumilaceae archaeon]|nr:methyltransferase domain-containing protein [Nitrosopumilaceae archaeon]